MADDQTVSTRPYECDFTRRAPCDDRSDSTAIDTSQLSDGAHRVVVQATDPAANTASSAAGQLLVDNNPPASPIEMSVIGGEGWRRTNDFAFAWRSPDQGAGSPIDALGYQFCPSELPAQRTDGCAPAQFTVVVAALDGRDPQLSLPAGAYQLRARARDEAGNEAGTDKRDDGTPASLTLPVRSGTVLQLGALGKRSCRGRGKRRACTRKLRPRVSVAFRGRRPRLFGRLVGEDRRPLGATELQMIRIDRDGSQRAPVRLRTSKSGRFSVRPGAGPARLLRFRYPGTSHRRGATAQVDWRVRGTTTLHLPTRPLVNGDHVTFAGRVRGRPIPAAGKLVELQVYTRRMWRTFAQPRTDRTGRWTHRYRFEQVNRTTRFRFRARVRAEAGYPYYTGTSRQAKLLVRGRQAVILRR